MKEQYQKQLVEIINGMTENQSLWLLTFLNRLFGKVDGVNG